MEASCSQGDLAISFKFNQWAFLLLSLVSFIFSSVARNCGILAPWHGAKLAPSQFSDRPLYPAEQ